jgi:PAS domain S-box-containing protein
MVNSEFEVLSGYKKEDLESKKTWMECVSPGYLAWLIKEKKRLETADYNICVHHEFRFRDRWGHVKYCILNAALIPGTTKIAASFLDVTDRRQAEQNLKETGRLLEAIIKSAPLAILVIDNDDKVSLWNPAAEAMFGWNEQEIIKRKIPIIPENKDAEYEYIRETVRSGQMVKSMKTQRAKKDGSLIDVSLSVAPLMDADGKMIGRMGIFADISESLRAERRLRENEEKYRNIFENIQDVYFEVDMNGIVQEASPSIEFEMGYMREELIGRPASDLYLRDEEKKSFLKIIHQEGQIRDYEAHLRHKNQAVLVCSLNGKLAYEDNGNLVGFIISLRNVTKRKTAEDALRRAEEKYRSIVENAVEGIIQISPDGRFLSANQAFADMLGYDSPEELMTTITNIADQLIVDPQDVIRFVEQKEKDLIVKGFETRLYRKDGSALWILFNNRAVSDADDKLLYEENFCQDITSRKTAEERLQETLQSLRNALSTTIQAMIAAVESKDPYTAGHQLRSADLSCAIARELGLSEEKIEAIHMAGSIHDIGKLSIPSELLTKPTKLTDLEFRLVKEHARRGYDILKEVGHDCLLAETIHQHHERINGSGYPRGLTGSKILLDARILMVADVVESMASHRPYRAALGIQAALEEIEKNRGILYDADVVDACLRLFREKGFQLKESDELPILS